MSVKLKLFGIAVLFLIACGDKENPVVKDPQQNQTPPAGNKPNNSSPSGYDLDAKGIPQFATANYIELSKIFKISKFRSAEGHDYSDNFEKCRSMKHYFHPRFGEDWGAIKIYSPVNGTIAKVVTEWAGKQVHITPDNYPEFRVILFHVNLNSALQVGTKLTAAQQIGTHISDQTQSDITIGVETTKGWKLLSWFDVIKDDVFNSYKARGITTRTQLIITKDARDNDPAICEGEAFKQKGSLAGWVELN